MDERRQDRIVGCLLGGAVGDALGAGIEFLSIEEIRDRFGSDGVTGMTEAYGRVGAITDDTQMTMFTAEGIIRTYVRGWSRGLAAFENVVDHAYARWLLTQSIRSRRWSQFWEQPDTPSEDGWLIGVKALHERRAPGTTCLSALGEGDYGSIEHPLNDSKGCGGVMRMAPAGLFTLGPIAFDEAAFASPMTVGCELAALTHGHPSGYLAAGALATMVHAIAWHDQPADEALDTAERLLLAKQGASEVLSALRQARELASEGPEPSYDVVQRLGAGWVAEEALAIAVYCSLIAHDFSAGVLLAVNHSGDSDSTGAIAGNILGAIHGKDGIPSLWLQELELREEITQLAEDWIDLVDTHERIDWEGYGGELPPEPWWQRYPGW
jgi:ADP-ribosylglycohydrolase